MNRLEKQIADKQKELQTLIDFSNLMLAKLEVDKPKLEKILKRYGAKDFNYDNLFVYKSHFNSALYLRVYMKCNDLDLTKRKRENLTNILRKSNIPMVIGGVSSKGIDLIYSL